MVFAYTTNLTEGSVDVGTGAQQGTLPKTLPPPSVREVTATATFSNLNYRKNSATRFNDLAFWYSFDEASGATATDFSNNGRDATLKNMTAANRVGGKIGNALSFDTPTSKTSSDGSGQHLDLGSWSFGGAHTYTAWVKVDEWRSKAPLLFLSGSDEVNLGFDIDANGKLGAFRAQYKELRGEMNLSIWNSLAQWGQWIHLAVVQSDEGANLSTTKFYKNGTIFAYLYPSNKTAPDAVSRTPQYIGRSDASNNVDYFAGDLDEVRLYKVALSADEVSAVYSETNGTTWYTVTSNSGTDYSATGLPSGLAINPTTGEISGHPTEIGDHNVTVTASNLAGSDSKVVTITVNPTAPLLQSGLYQPTGMSLWLDAADASTLSQSSNLVNKWDDKSGNNYHATAPAGEEPTTGAAQINGENVLTWGRYIKMNRSTPTSANWQDVYIVAQYTGGSTFTDVPTIIGGTTSANSDNGIQGGANSGNGLWINTWTDNFYLNGSSNNGSNVVSTMTSPFLVSFSKNSAISLTGYQIGADRTNCGKRMERPIW